MTRAFIRLDHEGIDVQDCLDAVGRAERRTSWLAVGLTALLALSIGVGGITWWTLSSEVAILRDELASERSLRGETQARLACAEMLPNHAPSTRADVVTVARRADWLGRCAERELRRAAR